MVFKLAERHSVPRSPVADNANPSGVIVPAVEAVAGELFKSGDIFSEAPLQLGHQVFGDVRFRCWWFVRTVHDLLNHPAHRFGQPVEVPVQ